VAVLGDRTNNRRVCGEHQRFDRGNSRNVTRLYAAIPVHEVSVGGAVAFASIAQSQRESRRSLNACLLVDDVTRAADPHNAKARRNAQRFWQHEILIRSPRRLKKHYSPAQYSTGKCGPAIAVKMRCQLQGP
jgi:hypothetical protein